MHWDSFVEQIRGWLRGRGLLQPRLRWVVGVSGGRDSTLLLRVLHELSRRDELAWELHAAHLHHGIRGAEADADAKFVAEAAEGLRVACHLDRVDVPGSVKRGGGSTEEVARLHRYEFLERIALKVGSEDVAVAHHADDNAETILHRICRGTGLRGLGGMHDIRAIQPGSRVRLVRPFLSQRRETIEDLCRQLQLTWRSDSSNESVDLTRGKVRHLVLPLLRAELNPNVAEALLRLGEQARWLGTYLEDAAARVFDTLVISEAPGQLSLNVKALLAKQRIIQAEVIRRAVSFLLGREQDIGFGHVEGVMRLAEEATSGKELHLPGPAIVRKVYDRLEFRALEEHAAPAEIQSVFIDCPGLTALPQLGFTLAAEVREVEAGRIERLRSQPHPLEEWIDIERVQMPLLVRGRHEGDRFWPLGAPGAKSLGEFLSDEKIDPLARARTGVLCDQAGPVWVMPLRIDERVKLRPGSRRAIRLLLSPASPQRLTAS